MSRFGKNFSGQMSAAIFVFVILGGIPGTGLYSPDATAAIRSPAHFNTHTRTNDGPGLGLPITKQLIELHGGTFRIDSAPDKGTRVILKVPMSPPAHLIKAA